jgi:hypothetical protein
MLRKNEFTVIFLDLSVSTLNAMKNKELAVVPGVARDF